MYRSPGEDRKVRRLETGGPGLTFLSLRAYCKNAGIVYFDVRRALNVLCNFSIFMGVLVFTQKNAHQALTIH